MNRIVLKQTGILIKNKRKEAKLTQVELASKIGVTESLIRKYEAGLVEPPIQNIVKIAKVLNVSAEVITKSVIDEIRDELGVS